MTALRLILIRHGETVGNSSIRYYGRTDIVLSELGHEQMRAATQALATSFQISRFAQVFASPLTRAQESARIVAGPDAAVTTIEAFREVDFGDFEGLTADEIRDRFPAEYQRWNRDRLAPDYAYPNGERRAAFTARVERGVDRMLEHLGAAAADPALVVAHRGVIRAVTHRLAGVEPVIDLGSMQMLTRKADEGWRVAHLDYVEHLKRAG